MQPTSLDLSNPGPGQALELAFEAGQTTRKTRKLTREPTRDAPGRADLLRRVFGEDVLVCRGCGASILPS